MFGFFKKGTSKKTAKQRLMTVISRDRANVSAEFILKMTADIIATAIKYIGPDYDNISITFARSQAGAYLSAKMPVVAYKETALNA